MTSIIERAQEHFNANEMQSIYVPEWKCKIRYKPLTMYERRKIYKPNDQGVPPDGVTSMIRALIVKSLDEKGAQIFSEMDENKLLHGVCPDVVSRIGRKLLNLDRKKETVEEAGNG